MEAEGGDVEEDVGAEDAVDGEFGAEGTGVALLLNCEYVF